MLDALLTMAIDPKFIFRYGMSPLLFDFRDDPRVKPMLKKMAADPDHEVSDEAKQYLGKTRQRE